MHLKGTRLTRNQDHNDLSGGETADTTTQYGLKLLDLVKKTEDKGYDSHDFPLRRPRYTHQPCSRVQTCI